MEMANIKPKVQPIRGGTDGANLSFMGLPCPNIFAGGHNFHGKLEYVPLESMMKASEVILNIITLFQAERQDNKINQKKERLPRYRGSLTHNY